MLTLLLVLVASSVAVPSLEQLSRSVASESANVMPWLAAVRPQAERSLRICLVQDPSFSVLALELKARGHVVTVASFAESDMAVPLGVQRLTLAAPSINQGNYGAEFESSVAAYETLKTTDFDLIVFSSASGLAYMSQEAKRSSLHFQTTGIIVQAHARWASQADGSSLRSKVARFISRKSIELADSVFLSAGESLDGRTFERPVSVWRVADNGKLVSLIEAVTTVKPHDNVITHPRVTAIVTSFNRPALLKEAVASLKSQTYANIEIIVVDDASTAEGMVGTLADLESSGVKVIRLETNGYLGHARNIAAQEAIGQYLVFLDDDNVALPTMVASLVTAAQNSASDVAVSGHYIWKAAAGTPIPSDVSVLPKWFPVGPDVVSGYYTNVFGNANFLVSRETFYTLSGFSEDRTGLEDHEFHARACLAGVEYVVVPEVLMLYREHDITTQMYQTMDRAASRARVERAYGEVTRGMHSHDTRVATACSGTFSFQASTGDNVPNCNTAVLTLYIEDNTFSSYAPQTIFPDIFVQAVANGLEQTRITSRVTCGQDGSAAGRVKYVCQLNDNALNDVNIPTFTPNAGTDNQATPSFIATFNVTEGPAAPVLTCTPNPIPGSACILSRPVCFHEDSEITYKGVAHTLASIRSEPECHVPHEVFAKGVSIATTCSDKPLRLTDTHLVYSGRGLVKAAELKKGDTLFKDLAEKDQCKVVSVTKEAETQKYFGLNCISSQVTANGAKTSTFGDLHTLPAMWMASVGRLFGIERASVWGDAISVKAHHYGIY